MSQYKDPVIKQLYISLESFFHGSSFKTLMGEPLGWKGEPLGRTRCTVPVSEMADVLFSWKGDGVAFLEATKTSFLPPKKKLPYTKVLFFSAQKRNPSKNSFRTSSKKRRLGCFFFRPPPVQKVIHHDPSLQKISKKNPSKMQVKISSSARFGVLVLCSWPQSFFGKKITPRAAECYQPPRRGKAIHLAVGEDRVLRLRLHWFQVFENPNFAPKKMVESERCLTCLVCSHEEKDYKVAKMPLRDSCVEELYLGLGDIFNMVESFEWKFQKLLQVRDAED